LSTPASDAGVAAAVVVCPMTFPQSLTCFGIKLIPQLNCGGVRTPIVTPATAAVAEAAAAAAFNAAGSSKLLLCC
jgi:hypothetical protein